MPSLWNGMITLSLMAGLAAAPPAAAAQAPSGRQIAQRDCGACHAVTASDQSRNPAAPPFRSLGQRYDVGDLAEALAEGISVGHPKMPMFSYPPDQIRRLIDYLRSLQPSQPRIKESPRSAR